MDIYQARKIHCLGIGGIGVSALAKLFEAQGKEVSGFDDGIPNDQCPMTNDVDLIIYSDAVAEDHPQRVMAREGGILEISYAQALGQISRDYRTIVVAGTHGKSTTTAMLGLILEAASMDPLVIVGTKVPGWKYGNLRVPKDFANGFQPANDANIRAIRGEAFAKSFFVVEGDDYRDHFLELSPYAVVITNIEYDHPDYFRDLDHTIESFRKLIEKVPEDGFVILNNDDKGCQLVRSAIRANRRIIKYGRGDGLWNDLQIQVPGEFNKYNALAAATCARELGVNDEIIKKTISEFKGAWRRFEVVGCLRLKDSANGLGPANNTNIRAIRGEAFARSPTTIISDYGHHPTAIRETMKAAREAYPGQRLVLVYQPHQHSRTRYLFNDFVDALKHAADVVIVSEIYAVKGRLEDRNVSSRDIVEAIGRTPLRGGAPPLSGVIYGGDLAQTEKLARDIIQKGDVVIFMGAGDIDKLARELIKDSANGQSPANNANGYIVEGDLSYKLNGLLFQVQNELGTKFQEKHYNKALEALLQKNSIKYKKEFEFDVKFQDANIGKFRVDFIIEGKILIELKTTDRLSNDHIQQMLRYVEALNIPLGLVVNFRKRPLDIRRVVNTRNNLRNSRPQAFA